MRVILFGETPDLQKAASVVLVSNGYVADCFKSPEEIQSRQISSPHVFAFLLSSPGRVKEIKDLIGQLRVSYPQTSIFVHCPRTGKKEEVDFLNVGADDCIFGSFKPELFLAHIRALLRRRILNGELTDTDSTVISSWGPVTMNLIQRRAFWNGEKLDLRRIEFDLLSYFIRHVNKPLSRKQLLQDVWGYPHDVRTRTLDKHIQLLRKRFGRYSRFLQTHPNYGYMLKDVKDNRKPAAAKTRKIK